MYKPPVVFMSHVSDDKKRLEPLAQALQVRDFAVWLDRPNPVKLPFKRERERRVRGGQHWRQEALQGIIDAQCVLVFWSEKVQARLAKNDAEHFLFELQNAQHLEKAIVVRVDRDCAVLPQFRRMSMQASGS